MVWLRPQGLAAAWFGFGCLSVVLSRLDNPRFVSQTLPRDVPVRIAQAISSVFRGVKTQ
ncbi:MAG: hypothetical protein ACK517_02800 [bacterium]|jgi:hypothetical protein